MSGPILPPTLDAPGRAEALAALGARHGVSKLDLFGSATGGSFDAARSDVDLLVEFQTRTPQGGLAAQFALAEALEALFGRKVDLVEGPVARLRNPYLRRSVEASLWPLLPLGRPVPTAGVQDLARAQAVNPRAAKLLWDVLDAARFVADAIASRDADGFAADPMLRLAIERQLITIGEALARLRRDAPEVAPQVPLLHQAVGLRNILVHNYDGAEPGVVWDAASVHLPVLVAAILGLIDDDPSA